MSRMGIIKYALVGFSFIAPVCLAYYDTGYTDECSLIAFSNTTPTLLSILLAAVLASIAIIFGLTGIEELKVISAIEKARGRDLYSDAMRDLKWDIYSIFVSFIISSLLIIFSINTSTYMIPFFNDYVFKTYKTIFIIDAIFLIISFIATYDIICGLFYICQLKYEFAKNNLTLPK